MGDIVDFHGRTLVNIPPEKILEGAHKARLTDCVVVGYDDKGALYFASSVANGGDIMWMFESAKKLLLEMPE